MNILYISSKKRWGGVISWMENTSKALTSRGHNVWIITHPNSKYSAQVNDREKIIVRKLGSEYSPITIYYLVKFIKEKQIDLVVTNLEKEVGIGGIAAKISGIPNIRRVGSEDDFFDRFKTKWNHQNLVSKSIVPCDDIKEKVIIKSPWLKTHNFTTIYNGRNPRNFSEDEIDRIRNFWGVEKENIVIGITVQLLPVKQVDKLIEAFKKLVADLKLLRLVVTGTGRELKNLEELAISLKLEREVVFAGFTEDPILTAAGYDIAVLNSAKEGFPNSIVEYFAASKPVVSTNVGGVREIIEDGVNGFLIENGDSDQLVEKIKILAQNTELRERFSIQALNTLQNKFTEKHMIDDLESYFKEAIKS